MTTVAQDESDSMSDHVIVMTTCMELKIQPNSLVRGYIVA